MNKEAWDVLQEDERGSNLAKDPFDVVPDPSLVVFSEAFPGDGEGLAWEARRDEIHSVTKRSAVEGREVVPDRSRIQGLFFHPGHEDGRRVCFPLDVCQNPVGGEDESDSEFQPSDPGA